MSQQWSWKKQQSRTNRSGNEMTERNNQFAAQEKDLEEALRNFRMSVHAWSDASLSRPRAAVAAARNSVWRAAAGWALGCALVAGIVTGGVFQYQRGVQQQRAAAVARRIQQQAAARANAASDALLAHVDSDVSREVPAAMDPLASLVGGME